MKRNLIFLRMGWTMNLFQAKFDSTVNRIRKWKERIFKVFQTSVMAYVGIVMVLGTVYVVFQKRKKRKKEEISVSPIKPVSTSTSTCPDVLITHGTPPRAETESVTTLDIEDLDFSNVEQELTVTYPRRKEQGFQTDLFSSDYSSNEDYREELVASFSTEKRIFETIRGDEIFRADFDQQEPILLNTILQVISNDKKCIIKLKETDSRMYITLTHLVLLEPAKGRIYSFEEDIGDVSEASPFTEFDSRSRSFPCIVMFDVWKCAKVIVIKKDKQYENMTNILKNMLFVGYTSDFYTVKSRVPKIPLKKVLNVYDRGPSQGNCSSDDDFPIARTPREENLMSQSLILPKTPREFEYMKKFNQVDSNRDGELTAVEIYEFLKSRGEEFSLKIIKSYVKKIDFRGNGKVTFSEFVNALEEIESELSQPQFGELTDEDDNSDLDE